MRDLLARHGIVVRGRRLRCPDPEHEDKHPSAWLTDSDRVRFYSCGFYGDVLDVAGALGEAVNLRGSGGVPQAPPPKPRPDRHLRAFTRALAARPEFASEWEATKLLALLPGDRARVEVTRNFDYLRARGDVALMLRGADLLRDVARSQLCKPESRDDPDAVADGVRSLLREVSA